MRVHWNEPYALGIHRYVMFRALSFRALLTQTTSPEVESHPARRFEIARPLLWGVLV